MDFAFMRRRRITLEDSYNSDRHAINPLRRARLPKPRGHRKVPMNIQGVTGGIYKRDLVHRPYSAFV